MGTVTCRLHQILSSLTVISLFSMLKILVALLLLSLLPVHASDCRYLSSPPDATRAAGQNNIAQAWYGGATTRYAHAVLGDSIEADTLYIKQHNQSGCALSLTLAPHSVFEDITPRIADVTGDGQDNVITIESHEDYGASLAIYAIKDRQVVKVTSTPYIGTRFRWLAPIGTADFNADDILDIALIRTPHLAGVLQIWSFAAESPELLIAEAGYSNHKIGQNFITGGISVCSDGPRIVVPDIRWQNTLTVSLTNGTLNTLHSAAGTDSQTISRGLQCP